MEEGVCVRERECVCVFSCLRVSACVRAQCKRPHLCVSAEHGHRSEGRRTSRSRGRGICQRNQPQQTHCSSPSSLRP